MSSKGRTLNQKIINGCSNIVGAFSLVILSTTKLYIIRDQWGVRPLILGKINGKGWIAASETAAIESIGGESLREVKPGEFIEVSKKGLQTFHQINNKKGGMCIFEYVYFSRPDSILNNRLIYSTRIKAGQLLAKEHPVKADLVMSVPDSGTAAALGFSQESSIPFHEGLIKSRYVGRTFIQPSQRIRNLGVSIKFSPLKKILKNKSVVLVDDSVVRGTTIAQIIQMLRKAGVKKIHLRVASPPFRKVCYLGIDVNRYTELIAQELNIEEIRKEIDADTLGYLSLPQLKRTVGRSKNGFCTGCFDGHYSI